MVAIRDVTEQLQDRSDIVLEQFLTHIMRRNAVIAKRNKSLMDKDLRMFCDANDEAFEVISSISEDFLNLVDEYKKRIAYEIRLLEVMPEDAFEKVKVLE